MEKVDINCDKCQPIFKNEKDNGKNGWTIHVGDARS